jgi:DNA-directed RNA polymerase subunit K/omega
MANTYSRDELAEKAGGFFALAALINKRKKELATGMPPFVSIDSDDYDDIIYEEIMQGKIKLKQAVFVPNNGKNT